MSYTLLFLNKKFNCAKLHFSKKVYSFKIEKKIFFKEAQDGCLTKPV